MESAISLFRGKSFLKLYSFLQSSHGRRSNLDTCVVQHRRVCAIMQITSEHETEC